MLEYFPMLDALLFPQTVDYLNQVLSDDAACVSLGEKTAPLPYFLLDTYDIVAAELLGYPVTFACLKGHQAVGAQQIDQHTKRLAELLDTPVIVVLPEITPGERKQLIQRRIAFVVPRRQLFAPQMGMILTERYGVRARAAQVLASPATQALLLWFLNQHPVTDVWHPFEDAAALGYAGMTATRAIRELLQFDLFELEERGRAKYLRLNGSRRELWEKAKPHLRTPVKSTLWTYDRRILDMTEARWAGESALARLSMLNDPAQQVIALTASAAKLARQRGVFFEPRQLADGLAVQVWHYRPDMLAKESTVDPLSLWLSLVDNRDDRIQMALDDIEEKYRW